MHIEPKEVFGFGINLISSKSYYRAVWLPFLKSVFGFEKQGENKENTWNIFDHHFSFVMKNT